MKTAVIQNISQLSARPETSYMTCSTLLSHKPWDNPMVHRWQKIDLYNTDVIHLMQSGVVAPTPRHTILMDMKQFTPVWDKIERWQIFKSIR